MGTKAKKTKTVTITLVGNKGSLNGSPVLLKKVYDKLRIRHPNAWFAIKQSRGKWDGYIKYLSDYGDFQIGLLNRVVSIIRDIDKEAKIIIDDKRLPMPKPKLISKVGNYQLRDIQKKALSDFINNHVEGFPFYIGVINAATNFGKTLLMAAIHESFNRKLKTLVILNNSLVFAQAKKEYPGYLPNEDIKFIQGKQLSFGNFNVGMVQTMAQKVKEIRQDLSQIDIVLVDEADVADNKQFKVVLSYLYNARVRLGLSGSIYMSKLKKDIVHNMNLRCFFGDEIHKTTKAQMVKKGYSTPLIIKIVPGNDRNPARENIPNWLDVFKEAVIDNKVANEKSAKRVLYNIKYNRLPALVVTRFIGHADALYKYFTSHKELRKYNIQVIDHNSKNREFIVNQFAQGKVDVLITTYIIKRGINLPLAVYLQNAAGSDSEEDISQLCGRMERTFKGKAKSYIDDLYYYGPYLEKHSKHRVNYYKKTKMKVINLVKKGKRR